MLFGAMPRLSVGDVGIWPMNGRQRNENTKMRHEAAADDAVVRGRPGSPPSSRRQPAWLAPASAAAGRRITSEGDDHEQVGQRR